MLSDEDIIDILEEAIGTNKALLYLPLNHDDLVAIVKTTEKWINHDT